MKHETVLKEFRDADALLDGHFVLSSGLHSRNYLQCAKVLMDPKRAARLARALAKQIRENVSGDIDCVVSPAMGGVLIGYEVARQLGVRSMFLERVDRPLWRQGENRCAPHGVGTVNHRDICARSRAR